MRIRNIPFLWESVSGRAKYIVRQSRTITKNQRTERHGDVYV